MKRREFVEKLGIGSAALAAGSTLGDSPAVTTVEAQEHHHEQVNGPLASATVSFGQWLAGPSASRFPNLSPRELNQHLLIPYAPVIKAGGSVNFIVAGLHQVVVYAPRTRTTDINTTLTVPPSMVPPGAPPTFLLIDDPRNRVYRGLDPTLQPQDRVEVVSFAQPGTYLVICGFYPHFVNDNMHGFVRVVG
jgi:hypothetical protein